SRSLHDDFFRPADSLPLGLPRYHVRSSPVLGIPATVNRPSSNSTQFILHLSPMFRRGLFGSTRLERLAQLHARFVQLRFAVADGASHHSSNLVVFVSFHIVQYKNPSVSRRQRIHRALQPQPVNGA